MVSILRVFIQIMLRYDVKHVVCLPHMCETSLYGKAITGIDIYVCTAIATKANAQFDNQFADNQQTHIAFIIKSSFQFSLSEQHMFRGIIRKLILNFVHCCKLPSR